MGLTVMRSIKKALLMVPKLSPLFFIVDKNCAVQSYAFGKNKSSFMKLIDNGMYVLMLSEGEDDVVDGVGSNNDNEILGAMSVEGMRLSRGDMVEVLCSTEIIKEDTNCAGGEEKLGDYFSRQS
jgi:hypothetical protein